MQNFVFDSLKLIPNLFSGAPKLPLISKESPSPNTKKLCLRMPVWDDELLLIPKIIKFLAQSLPNFYSLLPLNAIS